MVLNRAAQHEEKKSIFLNITANFTKLFDEFHHNDLKNTKSGPNQYYNVCKLGNLLLKRNFCTFLSYYVLMF